MAVCLRGNNLRENESELFKDCKRGVEKELLRFDHFAP